MKDPPETNPKYMFFVCSLLRERQVAPQIRVSVVEVYNNDIRDLLNPGTPSNATPATRSGTFMSSFTQLHHFCNHLFVNRFDKPSIHSSGCHDQCGVLKSISLILGRICNGSGIQDSGISESRRSSLFLWLSSGKSRLISFRKE